MSWPKRLSHRCLPAAISLEFLPCLLEPRTWALASWATRAMTATASWNQRLIFHPRYTAIFLKNGFLRLRDGIRRFPGPLYPQTTARPMLPRRRKEVARQLKRLQAPPLRWGSPSRRSLKSRYLLRRSSGSESGLFRVPMVNRVRQYIFLRWGGPEPAKCGRRLAKMPKKIWKSRLARIKKTMQAWQRQPA